MFRDFDGAAPIVHCIAGKARNDADAIHDIHARCHCCRGVTPLQTAPPSPAARDASQIAECGFAVRWVRNVSPNKDNVLRVVPRAVVAEAGADGGDSAASESSRCFVSSCRLATRPTDAPRCFGRARPLAASYLKYFQTVELNRVKCPSIQTGKGEFMARRRRRPGRHKTGPRPGPL